MFPAGPGENYFPKSLGIRYFFIHRQRVVVLMPSRAAACSRFPLWLFRACWTAAFLASDGAPEGEEVIMEEEVVMEEAEMGAAGLSSCCSIWEAST